MDIDLSARYLGLALPSPIVVGACPLTAKAECARQLACCGAGALVLPSIFQEQLTPRRSDASVATEAVTAQRAERPAQDFCNLGPDEYLRTLDSVRRAVSIPVIASMNGWTGGSWLEFASEIEAAGADALELNLHNTRFDRRISGEQLERWLVDDVRAVCDAVAIPVAVKLEPFFTSLPNVASKLAAAGAAGLVLFGHEPQMDIRLDDFAPQLAWRLTPPGSIGLTLAALMHVRPSCPDLSLASSGGIASGGDLVKTLLAGADVAMITSAVYRDGGGVIRSVHDGVVNFLERKRLSTLAELCVHRAAGPHAATWEQMGCTGSLASADEDPPVPRRRPVASGDRYGHARIEPLSLD